MIAIMVIAGVIGLLFLGSILRGYVLSWLWAWFIVPLGMPQIGVAWAIGITVLISTIVPPTPIQDSTEIADEAVARLSKIFTRMVSVPMFGLLIGWIAHKAMGA